MPAASAEKTFTISEVLDLGSWKTAGGSTHPRRSRPLPDRRKLLANKAIIKGDILLKNLYASDVSAGTMEQVRHEIPFSQIIDVDGLSDDWQCQVFLDVVSSDVHISVNQNGESCLLAVSIKLTAQLPVLPHGFLRGSH